MTQIIYILALSYLLINYIFNSNKKEFCNVPKNFFLSIIFLAWIKIESLVLIL